MTGAAPKWAVAEIIVRTISIRRHSETNWFDNSILWVVPETTCAYVPIRQHPQSTVVRATPKIDSIRNQLFRQFLFVDSLRNQ